MNKSNLSAYVKENFIAIFGVAMVNLKAIVLLPLIIKTMGVTVYGGYVLLASLLSIVFSLSSLGVGISAKRYLPSSDGMDSRRKLFYPQFIFTFFMIALIAFLLFLLDQPIRSHLFNDKLYYSRYVIPCYLLAYFMYAQGCDYLRYTSRVPYMVLATTVYPYLHIGIVLTILYLLNFISINVLIVSETVSAGIIALVCFRVVLREIRGRIILYKISELLAEIRLGFPLMLTVIVDFVLAASDRYLISFFMTVTAVGYYNPGYLLGSLIIFLPKSMGLVLPQLMSKAVDNDGEQAAEVMLNYTVKLFLLFAIPFIFGSMVLSKEVLTLLTDADVAGNAYLITPIIAVGTVFYGLTYIITNILFVRLQTSMMLKVNVLAAVINFVANIVFLYIFRDILIAALTTLLSYVVSFVYINYKVRELWLINYDLVFVNKVIISSVIMASLVFFARDMFTALSPLGSLFILIAGAIAVLICSLIVLKAFSQKEILHLKSLLSK